jgi:hypothetical protein
MEASLAPAGDVGEPDVELLNHPIFSFFQSETNPLIRGVKIDRFRRVAEGWKPGSQQAVEVIASLRDKSPLVIEKRLGQGEVLLFLTTLAPDWNDWAKNPSFVVVALKMQSHLATARRLDDPQLVGSPLDVTLEAAKYLPEVSFVVPGERSGSRQRIERQAHSSPHAPREDGITRSVMPTMGDVMVASAGRTMVEGKPRGETDRAGIYEAWPKTTKGETDLRRWAFNVDPDEGDLRQVGSADLLTRLDPVKVNYHLADQYQQDEVAAKGYNLSTMILCGLILLLVGEQILAYSASYHVAPRGAG